MGNTKGIEWTGKYKWNRIKKGNTKGIEWIEKQKGDEMDGITQSRMDRQSQGKSNGYKTQQEWNE